MSMDLFSEEIVVADFCRTWTPMPSHGAASDGWYATERHGGITSPDQMEELRLPDPLETMGSKSESAFVASGRMVGWEEMEKK